MGSEEEEEEEKKKKIKTTNLNLLPPPSIRLFFSGLKDAGHDTILLIPSSTWNEISIRDQFHRHDIEKMIGY